MHYRPRRRSHRTRKLEVQDATPECVRMIRPQEHGPRDAEEPQAVQEAVIAELLGRLLGRR
jgi:hypothetical protein